MLLENHIQSYGKLLLVLVGLLCLTVLTVFMSNYDMGPLNVLIALLIASTKGSLVLLFFMHFKYEGPLLKYSFVATLMALAIIISFIFWDVAYR